MKKIKFISLITWVFCLFITNALAQNNQIISNNAQYEDIFYHTVERGQTVFSIAAMYGVKIEDIYKLNIGSDESIKVGEKLRIPQKKRSTSQISKSENSYIYHTIQTKETLYGVSKQYGVSGAQIIEANPGLSKETFAIGKTIRIPLNSKQKQTVEIVENKKGAKEIYYTVPSKETMYNICKTFKTSEKELLKLNPELAGGLHKGMTLRIPLRINEKNIPPEESFENENETNAMLTTKHGIKSVNVAKIALLLPYDAQSAKSKNNNRIVEYYEGMLLAVDSLRHKGLSSELFVYDIGDGATGTQKILQEKAADLKDANLIIGGLSNDQIKLISTFAEKNKIKYVIPFTSKNNEVLSNSYIFQINTPPQYLYANAAYAGANLFSNYNIIFLDTKDKDEHAADFVKEFKQELKSRNIQYKDAVYNSNNFDTSIKTVLDPGKPNVIMPLSSSLSALTKIKTVLRSIAEKSPEYNLTLFGYPVWQTYSKDCLDDFYALNTHIYSLYYADNTTPNVKNFYNNYKGWYSKNPMSTFPKYAMLGFDTGMYFFGAIQNYGDNFENNLSKIDYKSVQTGFNFERVNNWGGFINTNVYIIHYNKDFTITRSDFK